MTVYSYGVDLKSEFTFKDGDLNLSEYEDNIGQAIANRLNTIQDSLDLFYTDYGSLFLQFLGWRRTQSTLDFMKVELDNTLSKDPRINNFTTNLEYSDDGSVKITIQLTEYNNVTELNYVLNNNGIEEVSE